MPRYSWSKKSLVLYKKTKKKNITKFKDVNESYWSDVGKLWGLQNILLIQYQSSVALLSYFLRDLAKTLSLPRAPTSYRYGK